MTAEQQSGLIEMYEKFFKQFCKNGLTTQNSHDTMQDGREAESGQVPFHQR